MFRSSAVCRIRRCPPAARHLLLLVGTLVACRLARPLRALDPQDYAVQATAQVQTLPPKITLMWPGNSFATQYTISRKLESDPTWTPLATLAGAATGFSDTEVVSGAAYEYEVAESNSDGISAYGYIYAGMEVPFPSDRGQVILIVDSTVSAALANEIAVLEQDLVGDGWTVLRQDVGRSATPGQVKSVIQNSYRADPARTRAIFLLGHVPVPYSGDINPDLHANHLGAWPADVYYADLTGNWTDALVNDTSAEDPRNQNVPGDGKFDQSAVPATISLQIGRVDFNDLPAFAPRTEIDLLRQYLNKDHNYRHKVFDLPRRGLVRDNFGDIDGDAPATDAWRAFPAFFGSGAIDVASSGSFFSTLASRGYLWAYAGGGGEYYQADGVGSTSDFANQSPQCVFYMLDGSYFGDWDSTDNFLRAAIATGGDGLVAAWTGLPHWYLHHMALGETIGYSTRVTQNNRGLYKNHVNLGAGEVHISLMGDPTLRLHTVSPPKNFVAQQNADQSVNLSWSPSSDSVLGYYVFRATDAGGPFARLTRSFLTSNAYTDTSAPAGTKIYMVRAIKLESTGSGTYDNPSQGIFASVTGDGGNTGGNGDLPEVTIDALNPTTNEAGTVEGDFVITATGLTAGSVSVDYSVGGTAISGTDYQAVGNSVTLSASSPSVWVPIKPIQDGLTEGDETVTFTILPSPDYQVGSPAAATITIVDAVSNQLPQISVISSQSTTVNTETPPIAFTVSDAETPADALVVTASSSNPGLIPNSGIVLGGSGATRSLVLRPAADQTGSASITLTVSDGVLTTQTSFQVTVEPAGKIGSIAHQSDGRISLTLDGTPGQSYTVEASQDFLHWITIGAGTVGSGPADFLDAQSRTNAWLFYRVAWP